VTSYLFQSDSVMRIPVKPTIMPDRYRTASVTRLTDFAGTVFLRDLKQGDPFAEFQKKPIQCY
jgi:hypothetical protein